jgi:hypothetical protein
VNSLEYVNEIFKNNSVKEKQGGLSHVSEKVTNKPFEFRQNLP